MKRVFRIAVLSSLLVLVLLLTTACLRSSGDGSDDDTDLANDDNLAGDDDADDDLDDDDAVDDDADDDLDDDAADDDAEVPTGLLLISRDADGRASWRKTETGWERQEIPTPAAALWALGPAQFYGGERGWLTWNVVNAAGPLYYEQFTYTVEDGWQLDLNQPSPARRVAQSVAGTGPQHSWAIEWIAVSETVEASELIEIRGGERTQHLVTLYHGEYTALAFANETTGIVSVSVNGHAGYLVYDGWFWLPYEMPAGYEAQPFLWFAMESVTSPVWAIWGEPGTWQNNKLLVMPGSGQWAEVAPPAGCEGTHPNQIFANAGRALVIPRGYLEPENRFWVRQNDQWTCHTLAQGAFPIHGLILDDGRLLVLAQPADWRGQFQVFELRADGLHALPLPPGITRIDDIFAMGDNAPETSFASASEPLW